jgi:hypothetical protein
LFPASPASTRFSACAPLLSGLYGHRFRDDWNDVAVELSSTCVRIISSAKKIGRSFGSPLGNDRPITWAVNGFGHQPRLILSLSPFVDSIHARNAGTTIIVPPVG